jgi:hypothetical protein
MEPPLFLGHQSVPIPGKWVTKKLNRYQTENTHKEGDFYLVYA